MFLSDHFTFNEMTNTSHSSLLIENRSEAAKLNNIVCLTRLCCEVLEPLRMSWGKPLKVNSGFRSLKLNTTIKGSKTSQHLLGQAADITAGDHQTNKLLWELARKLALEGKISFGQLILEIPKHTSWVHISTPTATKRNEVLIFDGKAYQPVSLREEIQIKF